MLLLVLTYVSCCFGDTNSTECIPRDGICRPLVKNVWDRFEKWRMKPELSLSGEWSGSAHLQQSHLWTEKIRRARLTAIIRCFTDMEAIRGCPTSTTKASLLRLNLPPPRPLVRRSSRAAPTLLSGLSAECRRSLPGLQLPSTIAVGEKDTV